MFFKPNKHYYIIFFLSLFVYLLSCFGFFNGLSETVAHSLYNALGYTNKWSHTYGPDWFVGSIGDISALGSRELVLVFTVFIYFYLSITRSKKDAKYFLLTVGLGIILILFTKSITSKLEDLSLNSLLTESLSNFPSGHTFIATVLYLAIAKYLNSDKKVLQANKYLFTFAIIVIILVGISRFVGSGHTVTEVIAGWSLGICWFTFSQLFLRTDNKTTTNK